MATMLFPLPNYHSSSNLTFPLPYLTFPSKLPSSNLKLHTFFISPLKRFNLTNLNSPFITFSTSHSSDQSPSPTSSISYDPQNSFPKFTRFLTNEELERFQFLENYTYSCKLPTGYLSIRMMKDVELQKTVDLLAESFAESMFLPNMYSNFLGFLIKQYLVDRRGLMPYCATLIGFFKEEKGDADDQANEGEFAGTVEVSFDKRGANSSPPTPTAPKNCPYICNMTVKEQFRRRGIGWHLLKASEELISKISSSRNVYLHCRVIDSAPFNMYKKAGYAVVKTDSFLVLLTLQRRKHLMCKELPIPSNPTETVIAMDEEEAPSFVDGSEPEPVLFDEVLPSSVDMDG